MFLVYLSSDKCCILQGRANQYFLFGKEGVGGKIYVFPPPSRTGRQFEFWYSWPTFIWMYLEKLTLLPSLIDLNKGVGEGGVRRNQSCSH